ncbi:MAG: peptidoglycan DD-metalloendopeptidase family protein [Erysipelotrichales bacterium]|nr:peptidoglycan DD-metalloendopeptidase family protein [Erysipelotrichales bacterium]
MKRLVRISLIIIFAIFISVPTYNVYAASDAQTLAELRRDLAAYKAQKSENTKKQNATKAEINSAKNSVSNKQVEIEANQKKVNDAIQESEQLEKEIANGKKELAELVQNYQIASGDNIYLEYIFKATSFEDLVYRYAVMEQIMNYQESLISTWKDKIEYNKQLKVDLEAREVTLNQQIKDLAKEIDNLNDELEDYFDISLSVEQDIKSTQELITTYEKMGCKENQNLQECIGELGDTRLIRPLNKGVITSLWGYRTHPTTGVANTFHNGIDIGGNSVGTSVYSAANGMVGKIIYKASCGGNQVYIYHNINGKKYTTVYMHLNSINVKLGQIVKNSSVIGTVGGQKGTGDTCTTGAHLHFGTGSGWYGSDYTSSSTWKAKSINPATLVSFPGKGKYFYSRNG